MSIAYSDKIAFIWSTSIGHGYFNFLICTVPLWPSCFFLKVAFWQSFLVLLKCFANRQAQRHEACESFRGIIKPVCKILFLVMMYTYCL